MGFQHQARLVGLAVGSGLLLCTAAMAQEEVTFQLNWIAGGANAGFAAAKAEGFYEEAGLDVEIIQAMVRRTPRSSSRAARSASPMPMPSPSAS